MGVVGETHKHSGSTAALVGGVCGGILLLAVLAFMLLRRRRRRRTGYPRHPPELAPAPFTHTASKNIYSANQPAIVTTRMDDDIPQVNGVPNKNARRWDQTTQQIRTQAFRISAC